MTQLRANINQTENEKKRKRDSKKSQVNTTLPIIESNNQQIEDTIDTTNYITTEEDWDERLKEWYELLDEEEDTQSLINDDILLDNNESNNNLLSSYIHPAIDINAKWNLRDLFIRELEKPEFISTSSEFN
jgi:hypothetical protein